jgi:hypothetical protein
MSKSKSERGIAMELHNCEACARRHVCRYKSTIENIQKATSNRVEDEKLPGKFTFRWDCIYYEWDYKAAGEEKD